MMASKKSGWKEKSLLRLGAFWRALSIVYYTALRTYVSYQNRPSRPKHNIRVCISRRSLLSLKQYWKALDNHFSLSFVEIGLFLENFIPGLRRKLLLPREIRQDQFQSLMLCGDCVEVCSLSCAGNIHLGENDSEDCFIRMKLIRYITARWCRAMHVQQLLEIIRYYGLYGIRCFGKEHSAHNFGLSTWQARGR